MFFIALVSVLMAIIGMGFIIINGLIALTVLGIILGYTLSKGLTKSIHTPICTGTKPKYAINRKTFFFFAPILPWLILSIVGLCFPTSSLSIFFSYPYGPYYILLIGLCVYLLCYIPAAYCRALDCGKPWFWVLLSIIPFLGIWFWGELLLSKSLWKSI